MKSLKGLLFIIASFLLTILTWMSTSPQFMIPGLALTSLSHMLAKRWQQAAE